MDIYCRCEPQRLRNPVPVVYKNPIVSQLKSSTHHSPLHHNHVQSPTHLVRHFTMQLTSLVLLFTASVALAAPGFVEDRAAAAECGRLCGVRILISTLEIVEPQI